MKSTTFRTAAFALLAYLAVAGLSGCNNSTGSADDPNAVQDSISAFLPQALMDSLTKYGMIFHGGSNPPDLQGNYFANSFYRMGGNVPNDNTTKFSNQSFRFSDQTARQRITAEYKGTNASAIGVGSFITGTGNQFTIYVPVVGKSVLGTDTVHYESAECYSGTIGEAGIAKLMKGFIITKKGEDPDKRVLNAGFGRVILETDSLAQRVPDYPHSIPAKSGASALNETWIGAWK